nr:immunoglobulin heavy chain junction region [Macaca mulatta]MOX93719.1 immunoglobulin heavy chain junction region [Macaca mulatta]MOX94171.1 immunoglobulin heavy chain junction region [Macaca mulatta]MOX94676.1 immunoglobulin heavy chain junction region [Macaca mulatta]MOX95106.1 immunoglobulin heavy chain junction region [Macaca mulatta]
CAKAHEGGFSLDVW